MRLDVRLQRQIAELHFHDQRQSSRSIAQQVGCSHNTVSFLRRKIRDSRRAWDELGRLDDDELTSAIGTGPAPGAQIKVRPDWPYIRSQLELRDASLQVLWMEFREREPNGIGYSMFTDEFRAFKESISVTMRVPRRAGEKLYCDFAGRRVPITDKETGEIRLAQVFVCTMGASSKMYAQAVWTQKEADWIDCHIKAFEFYGGVPTWTVPDNLKAAVIRRTGTHIDINAAYRECLRHYQTAAWPARPRKGNDKGSVEAGVRLLQSWVLFPWRTRTFFSLEELNEALKERVDFLNNKPIKGLGSNRSARFDQIDAPALKPLPKIPYEISAWRYNVVVGPDYRVEHDRSFYMVPYALTGHRVDLRITENVIEVVHKTKRVALHQRASVPGTDVVDRSFMPVGHRNVLEGEPKELMDWATGVGPGTTEVIKHHLCDRSDPTNGFRAAQKIRHLARLHGEGRIEEVCIYTGKHQMFALKHLEATIRSKADVSAKAVSDRGGHTQKATPVAHENNRDPAYFGGDQ